MQSLANRDPFRCFDQGPRRSSVPAKVPLSRAAAVKGLPAGCDPKGRRLAVRPPHAPAWMTATTASVSPLERHFTRHRSEHHGSCDTRDRVCACCRAAVDARAHLATIRRRTLVVLRPGRELAARASNLAGRDPRSADSACRRRSTSRRAHRPVDGTHSP